MYKYEERASQSSIDDFCHSGLGEGKVFKSAFVIGSAKPDELTNNGNLNHRLSD